MLKIIMSGLLALGMTACVAHQPVATTAVKVADKIVEVKREKRIVWHELNKETRELAAKENKMTIIFFYDDSEASTEMRARVWLDKCVADEVSDHFIFVGLNIEKSPGAQLFLKDKELKAPVVIFRLPTGVMVPMALGPLSAEKYCQGLGKVHEAFKESFGGN